MLALEKALVVHPEAVSCVAATVKVGGEKFAAVFADSLATVKHAASVSPAGLFVAGKGVLCSTLLLANTIPVAHAVRIARPLLGKRRAGFATNCICWAPVATYIVVAVGLVAMSESAFLDTLSRVGIPLAHCGAQAGCAVKVVTVTVTL